MAADNAAFLVASWIWVVVYMPLKSASLFPDWGMCVLMTSRTPVKWLLLLLVIGAVVGLLFFGMVVFESQDSLPVSFANWLRTYHMMLIGGLFALPPLGAWL
ncbi:MAG: hypothetical protein R3E31_21020 [Chloroflexota bacterium]